MYDPSTRFAILNETMLWDDRFDQRSNNSMRLSAKNYLIAALLITIDKTIY